MSYLGSFWGLLKLTEGLDEKITTPTLSQKGFAYGSVEASSESFGNWYNFLKAK